MAPERGYFVDQRWMDLAPGLIPSLFVLRDPGYNVAYWNLSSRDVRRTGDGYTVNGRPLRFFHFSGYDPAQPQLLSKHQDRIELDASPSCASCATATPERWPPRDTTDAAGSPTPSAALPDGIPLDGAARTVYREAVKAGTMSAADIFTEGGGRDFVAYLSAPATARWRPRRDALPRGRTGLATDLADAFPDLDGADGDRLVAWAQLSPAEVPPTLLGGGSASAPHRPGVNVAGYFEGVMGVGEHARQLAAALRTQGIPVATTTLHPEAAPEDHGLADARERQSGPLRVLQPAVRERRLRARRRRSARRGRSSRTATRSGSGPGR